MFSPGQWPESTEGFHRRLSPSSTLRAAQTHPFPSIPLEDSSALDPGNLRGGSLNSQLIPWPISSLGSLTLWLRAALGSPAAWCCLQGCSLPLGEDPLVPPSPRAGPLPEVPEILIFFTVLLVLLVT